MFDALPIPASLMPQPLDDEQVEALIEESLETAEGRWSIPDKSAAEWAMRRLAAAEHAINEVAANANEWKRRINEYVEEETRRDKRTAQFFTALLSEYALRLRAESGGKIKSVTLASGVVRTTKTGGRVTVEKPDEFTAWALDAGRTDLLRIVPQQGAVGAESQRVMLPSAIVLTCGCVTHVTLLSEGDDVAEWLVDHEVGRAFRCSGCKEDALIGRWLETYEVVTIAGTIAPGLGISEEGASATVNAH